MSVKTFLLIALGVAAAGAAQDSTPGSEFRRTSIGVLPDEEFGFSTLWNRDLGSGYSD